MHTCCVPVPTHGGLDTGFCMYALSWHSNMAALFACLPHIPVLPCAHLDTHIHSFVVFPCSHMVVYAGLFVHLLCPRTTTGFSPQAYLHAYSVPRDDQATWACFWPGHACHVPAQLCSSLAVAVCNDCYVPVLTYSSLGTPVCTRLCPRAVNLHACIFTWWPEHPCLYTCCISGQSQGGLQRSVCMLAISQGPNLAA